MITIDKLLRVEVAETQYVGECLHISYSLPLQVSSLPVTALPTEPGTAPTVNFSGDDPSSRTRDGFPWPDNY